MPNGPVRNIPGQPPSNGERHPPQGNENNPDTEPDKIPIYDQRPATENQGDDGGQKSDRRHRFIHIFQNLPKADALLTLFTFFLVVETFFTIRILSTTDDALHESAKAANEANQLNVSGLRPWVAVALDVVGPLTFDDRGAHLPLNARMQNLGRSPAQSVLIGVRLVLKGDRDAILERDKICDQLRKSEALPWGADSGFYLFPNQWAGGPRIINMSIEDLSVWRQYPNNPPAVVGCIEYKDTIFSEMHRTRFAVELDRKEADNPFLTINPNETSIPAANLSLNSNPFMPWSAD